MATRNICCFKGRGMVSLVGVDNFAAGLAGLLPRGNAEALTVTATETTESLPDYTTAVGGEDCRSRQIDKIEIALTLICHSIENLADSLYGVGSLANVASAAVVAEPHIAWPGAMVPLHGVPDRSIAIVVKGPMPEGGGTAAIYTEGTDYRITEAGSIQLLDGTTIPAPTVTAGTGAPNIFVDYTKAEQSRIELFRRAPLDQVLHFDGINIMTGGKPFAFDLYRVQFSPPKTLSILSANAGKLELTGSVLRDSRRSYGSSANPLSQYGTLTLS